MSACPPTHLLTMPSADPHVAAACSRRVIGVIGGGQLGRMLALAGAPLGFSFRFLDPDPECPAGELGDRVTGAYDDPASLSRLADGVDVVTFEFENVPAAPLALLAAQARVEPHPAALAAAQDRVEEKRLFERCGMEVAPWAIVDDSASLAAAVERIGVPGVLKTRRLGYDGKGQRVIRDATDAEAAFAALGGAPSIYEALVRFSREVSILAVRGAHGDFATWPIGENRHRDGILRSTLAPASVDAATAATLERHTRDLMERLDYRGVLAIEYLDDHGRLLANEMAPRVHNSGHWTIDGAVTSQFENHIRAVAGLPLGATTAIGPTVMVNLIGHVPPLAALLADPRVKVHLYGKSPRPGRKLGHLCAVGANADEAQRLRCSLEALAERGASDRS